MNQHVHLTAEDLLELALAQRGGRGSVDGLGSAQVRDCTECARGLEIASLDVQRVLSALPSTSPEDLRAERALAARVLDRTTREDLSWRGDCREVAHFVRAGIVRSRVLRLLAASLLVHLLALPVLAVALVLHMREARVPGALAFERAAAELPQSQVPHEPRRELVREPEPELPGPLSSMVVGLTRKERLERARRDLLDTGPPPAVGLETSAGSKGTTAARIDELLHARARRLALSGFDPALAEPSPTSPRLELALWAELLLDDWTLAGRADPRLASALARLAQTNDPPSAEAAKRLARHALARAASLGFPQGGLEAMGEEPLPAFGPDWFQALERACADLGVPPTSENLAAWLAWGRSLGR